MATFTTVDILEADRPQGDTAILRKDAPRLLAAQPMLSARKLAKHYGRVVGVDGVDLDVYPGEVMGIVGESGSGKSTVLRLLHFEEAPDPGGAYTLNIPGYEGTNLFGLDRFSKRQVRIVNIGIVYQNPYQGLRMRNTSSGNVAERLILAGERRYATLRDVARESLSVSEFPIQRMDDPPLQLSGGMQQRVQLAKAIAMKPTLLLLDEPTTGIDVASARQLRQLIDDIRWFVFWKIRVARLWMLEGYVHLLRTSSYRLLALKRMLCAKRRKKLEAANEALDRLLEYSCQGHADCGPN